MAISIVSFVIGAFIFVVSLIDKPTDQTGLIIMSLGHVCASIFIVGGFILLQLNKLLNKDKIKLLNS